jgi:predicted transcriptional regulator
MQLLEGIARGERAVDEGRTLTHDEAKSKLSRWLK